MKQLISRPCVIMGFATLIAALSLHAAPLPQRHPWQGVLRDHFATLQENDFAVTLQPVTYSAEAFDETDTVARYWMLFVIRQADIPSHQGIRLPPQLFTLSAIEAGATVNIGGNFMNSFDTAWWVQWPYPGNPYRGARPVKLRALVMAACDMMMQDEEHENGHNRRSDYLGGSLLRYTYVYRICRDALPMPVQQAYADGLKRMFAKLESFTPRGDGGSDMEFFQLSSMWYAADALGEDYMPRALARAHRVIDTITSKSGYELHGGAFDVSYQGIALRFLTWAAMLYNDPKIDAALHKMLVLKAHLSLPEPGGALYGPTHFNTGTAADAPNDQWAWVSRDFAMAMRDDLALYNIWARTTLPNEVRMREAVRQGIASLGGDTPYNEQPKAWAEHHWNRTLNFAHDLYVPGFYQRLRVLGDSGAPLTRPLYSRAENFIRDLNGGGEFLAAKFGGYATIIHSGAIAERWAKGVSGKSGGGLAALWTPQGGTYILGRCRATQSDVPDEWDDANGRGPYTWAVHAISGRNAAGDYFSTARINDLNADYEIDGINKAIATVSGTLGGHRLADPKGALKSGAYQRVVTVDKKRVSISSQIEFAADDNPEELWEMIPCHFGPDAAKTTVEISTAGMLCPIEETPHRTDQITITRYGKAITIDITPARDVRLAPAIDPRQTGGAHVRNIMISLTPIKKVIATSKYTITF